MITIRDLLLRKIRDHGPLSVSRLSFVSGMPQYQIRDYLKALVAEGSVTRDEHRRYEVQS